MKDTLSSEQGKLQTLQTKYEIVKENLKAVEGELSKSKEKVAGLEKMAANLQKEAKKKYIQLAEYEEHIGRAIDAAMGNMIFTMFLKHPNLD